MRRLSGSRSALPIAIPLALAWLPSMRAAAENGIAIGDVASLKPVWTTTLKGASRAWPIADGQSLYIPNSNGYLYRIDRQTGKIIWEIELAKVLDIVGASGSRGVAVTDNAVIFGLHNTPVVAAVDKNTGAFLWKTKVDDHSGAVMTQSPIIAGERVFIGVSGLGEEVAATRPPYDCCTFRGSMLALDVKTGNSRGKTHTVPEGFAGGSVWSSAPLLDAKRHALYVTTGNGFKAWPTSRRIDKNKGDQAALRACYPANVWYDSILALDPDTGAVKWGFRADDYDIFTGAVLGAEIRRLLRQWRGFRFRQRRTAVARGRSEWRPRPGRRRREIG